MAKFRSNHAGQTRGSGGTIVRVGLFGAIVAGLYWLFAQFGGQIATSPTQASDPYSAAAYYLPETNRDKYPLIRHNGYVLAYDEAHEQARWVAYILNGEELDRPWNDRKDNFRADPEVPSGSAEPTDYYRSGYDRGHLVPAADRAFDAAAQDETFFMSNISPQAAQFNQGIWRELEETVREWAQKYDQLYIVSGPVLTEAPKRTIGQRNKVSVPSRFFKVILDLEGPEQKGIGFLLPNQVSFDPLYEYAVPIDSVEQYTQIDFFSELMPDDLERAIESDLNIDFWYFDERKFRKRVEKWNIEAGTARN